MKVVDISVLRTIPNGEPIPLSCASDLSAYGYFQRSVSLFDIYCCVLYDIPLLCAFVLFSQLTQNITYYYCDSIKMTMDVFIPMQQLLTSWGSQRK